MIDHKDCITMFQNAIRRRDAEEAKTILYVMADSCPYRKDVCLDTKFCPDCEFYISNGFRNPFADDLETDNSIT